MAASATTEAQAELISSLSQDEIPIKLRCAICSRLAVNAFRLPCCEQAICENCQSTLPSSCPVCEHTPVAAEDCKPNKSLRTTIKVFLRTEEKKREALRLKEVKNSPPPTPVDAVATPVEAPAEVDTVEAKVADTVETNAEEPPAVAPNAVEETPVNETELSDKAEEDIPQPSIEEVAPGQEPTEESVEAGTKDTENNTAEGESPEKDANGEPISGQAISQAPGMAAGFGFNPSAGGAFPMGFGGDFNQMQMMMAMQNGGMGQNAFGNFPMMGMPGMGMDPMTMQNMFMNGGFGMNGMNGMNMNMGAGMGGFDGGVGAGFNNEWNGQQSWNVGPDNFNHPNAASMGTGDYGSNNSGYNPHASRYNQGNYGHGGQYNDYSGYGHQGRGRGRDGGGYGRGANGSNEAFSQQFPQQFGSREGTSGQNRETGQIPTGPKADADQGTTGNVDEFGREIRPVPEGGDTASGEPTTKDDAEATPGQGQEGTGVDQDNSIKDTTGQIDGQAPRPIQTLDEAEGYGANGFPGYNQGMSRGGFGPGFGGRGGFNPMQAAKPDVPINAPTGPKAMRDGLPNTGLSGLRVRGFAGVGVPISKPSGSPSMPPEPEQGEGNSKENQRSKSPSRDRSKERSRERRRSRSRDRHHRRHRSPISEDERESERRRERRRERHRRREDEGDDREDTGIEDKHAENEGRDIGDEKLRPASPSESKRSSHRSRHDRDKYRERDRDSDREYKSSSSHKHRSSNRHRDDRSRSRERDREHRHRHSRRGSEAVEDKPEKPERSIPPTPVEPEDPSARPSTATNGTLEIKGGGSRRQPPLDNIVIPTGPRQDRNPLSARERERDYNRGTESRQHREDEDPRHRQSRHRDSDRERERERTREKDRPRAPPTAPAVQDPHTIEREARNRERLLKEAQRIAGLGGMAGAGKRGREEGDEGRKGRRKSRRGEEGEEARLARLEAERESTRWN